MYSPNIKHKALELRRKGTSIDEISNILTINKSTISYWCRDIDLDEQAILRIKTRGKERSVRGLLRYSEKKRAERIERTINNKNEGARIIGNISDRDILMVGIGLYWGEGYKESNGELGFTNSSPSIIKFYINWLKLWKINKGDLIFRLTINNVFHKEEAQIRLFWVNLLKVSQAQFSKTTRIKTKIKKGFLKNKLTYKGILRVKVRRGLSLKNNILGAINHISTET